MGMTLILPINARRRKWVMMISVLLYLFCMIPNCITDSKLTTQKQLRFGKDGMFKILQIADMHYADGKSTDCLDVYPSEYASCSDLNTTAFLQRIILAEKPNLIVFLGDNIYGLDSTNARKSMNAAFAPAVDSNIPWVAVLGNHDQEGTLTRKGVMRHITEMKNTLSKLNPDNFYPINGFGNYNLEVEGVEDTDFGNKSLLNLYFLDSGDYAKGPFVTGFDWIKASQQIWFLMTSTKLQETYMNEPMPQKEAAPGLAFFHIPLPEYDSFDSSNIIGVKQESVDASSVNSGFFTALDAAEDVKAVFAGHDHINDFCGKLKNLNLCLAGGFGYHASGKIGWSRRARVVEVSLEKMENGKWGTVNSIITWKRLDDQILTEIDTHVLWSNNV